MENFVDYYKILNLGRNATEKEIKLAYLKALRNCNLEEKSNIKSANNTAEKQMLLIIKASEVLLNPAKRRQYNKKYDERKRGTAYTNVYVEDTAKYVPTEDYSEVWQKVEAQAKERKAKQAESIKPSIEKSKQPQASQQSLTNKSAESVRSKKTTSTSKTTTKGEKTSKNIASSSKNQTKTASNNTKTTSRSKTSTKQQKSKLPQWILNLKVRKNDNFLSYLYRNRYTIAIATAATITISVGARNLKDKKDDEIIATVTASETTEYMPEEMPTEAMPIVEEPQVTENTGIIRLERVHKIVPGDILSQFSIDSNTTQEEIKRVNGMNSNTVVLGTNLIIPYIIEEEDLDFYTQSATYTPGMSLDDYAKEYETNADTIAKLNPEAVSFDGTKYVVTTDSLLVPNFITKSDYEVLKAAERIKQKSYTNGN